MKISNICKFSNTENLQFSVCLVSNSSSSFAMEGRN